MKTRQEKQKELLITTNVKIDVYKKVKYTNKLKEKAFYPKKIDSVWAQIIPQTGKLQNQAADTMLANVSHKIKVRYAAGKNITEDMYFIARGKRFNIKYILNPYYSNEWLEIFCEQVVE
jgi:SPP1 family predicted phage head-tail adaptor